MMRETEGLFTVLVVWSVSYASAKNLECEGSIKSFSFYGQMVDCYQSYPPKGSVILQGNAIIVSPRFHLLVIFVIGVNQEKWEAGGAQNYQHQW